MKLAKTSLTSLTLITLALLLATPVHASPALSLGNTASYNLTATVKTVQSCSATASEGYACGTTPPQNITLSTISIYDNGTCSINTPTTCGFSPSTLYTTTGAEVRWINNGRLTHTLAANSSDFSAYDYMYPGWTYSHIFQTSGTYNYHDANYPWLTGHVRVSQAPPPTPSPPTVMQFSVGGPVAWQVVGLDTNTALLNVTHNISLTVIIAGIELKPVTETGSFEQSIDLATRTESAGTASAIIKEVLQDYATALSGSYYSGALSYLRYMTFDNSPVYTMWWVNGPLKNGSPVQLLNGYSSVRGSETVGLGGTVGDRDAWIVGSRFAQSLTLTTPPPSLGTTKVDFALSVRSDYDQTNDLLLSSNATVTATVTMQTIYNAGQQLCTTGYPYACVTLATMTVVTHQDTLNVAVNMQLTSSNVPFNQRSTTPGQAQAPSTLPRNPAPSIVDSSQSPASPLLLYASIAAIVLGGLAATLWAYWKGPLKRRTAPISPPALTI